MSAARLSTVVLDAYDAYDAHEAAGFSVRLLGCEVRADEPDGVLIGPPPGAPGTALAFETEPGYVPPGWPTAGAGSNR